MRVAELTLTLADVLRASGWGEYLPFHTRTATRCRVHILMGGTLLGTWNRYSFAPNRETVEADEVLAAFKADSLTDAMRRIRNQMRVWSLRHLPVGESLSFLTGDTLIEAERTREDRWFVRKEARDLALSGECDDAVSILRWAGVVV